MARKPTEFTVAPFSQEYFYGIQKHLDSMSDEAFSFVIDDLAYLAEPGHQWPLDRFVTWTVNESNRSDVYEAALDAYAPLPSIKEVLESYPSYREHHNNTTRGDYVVYFNDVPRLRASTNLPEGIDIVGMRPYTLGDKVVLYLDDTRGVSSGSDEASLSRNLDDNR